MKIPTVREVYCWKQCPTRKCSFSVFFNIYIEDLLIRLKNCRYDVRVGPVVGCLAYADDVTLISPAVNGTQRMLDICTSFATKKGLLFNSKKSFSCNFVRQEWEDLTF